MLDWLFYWQLSNKIKMASSNVLNTELVGSSLMALNLTVEVMPENVFYVDFRQKEYSNIIKAMFFE